MMEPLLHPFMMHMKRISKGDQHIHIQQNNHGLILYFLILKRVYHLTGDAPAACPF